MIKPTLPQEKSDAARGFQNVGFAGWFVQFALRLKNFDAAFEFEVFCLKLRILRLKFSNFLLERSQRDLSRRLDVLEADGFHGKSRLSSNDQTQRAAEGGRGGVRG